MSRKRLLMLLVLLTVVIVFATAAWIAGSAIQSPAEAAARTAAPTPAPILVSVEARVLSADVVTRGTARFGLPQLIALAPSSLKDATGIITTLPAQNRQLHEGDVLLTASGRPLFVLQGAIPMYRDFVPGLMGDDVLQLENSLARLGFDPGEIDGRYDTQTATAVADWYNAAGWQPFGATTVQLQNIRTLEQAVVVATNNQLTTAATATTATLAVAAARAEAEAANKSAAAELASANSTAQRDAAQAVVAAVQLKGDLAVQKALDAQDNAQRAAVVATDLVAQINADLATIQEAAGVKIPLDELVFMPTLPVRVEDLAVVIGDEASGPLLTVTNNQLAIDSSLPLAEAPLIKPGMAVAIDEPDLGIKATGVVERVADTPGTDGVDGFHIYFETLVDDTAVALEGFSLRLTIAVESTEGMVTAVPISALSLAADGTTRLQVDNNGTLEFVIVEPGLSADGFVEVTPVDGTLQPGQLVAIGFE